MTELVMGLGIVYALAFYEFLGRSPGGIVAPAYVAFFMDQPGRVAATLALSLLTYAVVTLAGRYVLLFGRRRTGLMLLAGFLLGWLWSNASAAAFPATPFDAIGFIVPGLIANDLDRQGIVTTWASLLLVSALVRLTLLALRGFGWL